MTTTLIEKVLPIIDEAALMTSDHEQGRIPTDEYLVSVNNRAEQIIALVEQDVARRLLSEEALVSQERRNAYLYDKSLTYGDNVIEQNRLGMIAALAAIGITVEEDQP